MTIARQPDRQLYHLAGDGRLLDHPGEADDEFLKLWDAPVHTPALRWGVYVF